MTERVTIARQFSSLSFISIFVWHALQIRKYISSHDIKYTVLTDHVLVRFDGLVPVPWLRSLSSVPIQTRHLDLCSGGCYRLWILYYSVQFST